MKKITILFTLIAFVAIKSNAQDSSHLRVSLLTCSQGDELYSIFGHTALRIVDSAKHTDIVYNYGTFDFNDPDFYMKFTRGTLDYMLSAYYFQDFMSEYYAEKRSVTEQELLLTGDAKNNLRKALDENRVGASRYYKYIFNTNNCTTRIRDLLFRFGGLKADRQLVAKGTTFRNQLHEYLDRGAQPWSKLGIDLLLGSPMDKKVSIAESMFLPDYLMKAVDSSVGSTNILKEKQVIYNANVRPKKNTNWPLYYFGVVMAVAIFISFKDNATAGSITRFFDVAVFLVTGLLGCFLLFMWFGTNHDACAYNFNLLWALPTNLLVAFALWKRPRWLKKYLSVVSVISLLTLVCWPILPQQLNIALLPIVIFLLIRSWQLQKAKA